MAFDSGSQFSTIPIPIRPDPVPSRPPLHSSSTSIPIRTEPVSSRPPPPSPPPPPPPFNTSFMATPPYNSFSGSQQGPAFSTFSYKITEKLGEDNYLLWLQQIDPVLRAHRLHRFCVSPQIPIQFLSEADRIAGIENPAYAAWEAQDQLLLAWLQASLSTSLMAKVIGCRYSWQLWDKIHHHCQSKTKAQARKLRANLRNTKKGDKSISSFLSAIKSITDSLLSIGETVSIQEQLDVILDGLPSEFESLVTLINSKSEWFEFSEIESLLLAHENRVNKQKELLTSVASLNLTQTATPGSAPSVPAPQVNATPSDSQNITAQPQGSGGFTGFRGGSRGFRGGRGGRRGGRGGRGNIQCQVCYKFGHDASICYHRFNTNFQPPLQQSPYPSQYGNPYQYIRPVFPPQNAMDDKVRVVQTLLFVEGINTLLQTLFGSRLPKVMGGSYAFMVPIISIIHDSSLASIEDQHLAGEDDGLIQSRYGSYED